MRPFLLFAALGMAAAAQAAPVTVTVLGPDGKPLAGAVVRVQSPRAPAAASGFAGPFVMAQKDIAFLPHLLIVPVGATVSFPNRDTVRHHVYSFSAAKRFELKLYGRQETRTVTFDRPGVIALGCNIHDVMSGFIVVVDTPWAALTDAGGRATFDVPPGAVTLSAWRPSARSGGDTIEQAAAVRPQGLSATLAIRR